MSLLSERPTVPAPPHTYRLVAAPPEPNPARRPPPSARWLETLGALGYALGLGVLGWAMLQVHAAAPKAHPAPVAEAATATGPEGPAAPADDVSRTPAIQPRREKRERSAGIVALPQVVVTTSAHGGAAPRGPEHDAPSTRRAAARSTAAAPPPTARRAAAARRIAKREAIEASIEDDLLALHRILPDLTEADVQEVVGEHRARLEQCYSRALRVAREARDVSVELTLHVSPGGEVEDASLHGDAPPTLGPCLVATARSWKFPASRAGAVVPIPLSLIAKDGPR